MTLFELPEQRRVPVGERRTTVVREHTRRVSPPAARATDPTTSQAAARAVDASSAPEAILGVLSSPLTAEEIADRLPHHRRDTVITAVSRLKRAGRIVSAGFTRPSSAGCEREAWRKA